MSAKLATNYHQAVRALEAAEARHNEIMERYFDAKAQRLPAKVADARDDVIASESNLELALHSACAAHREYWTAQRIALLPELHRAATNILRYNFVARAAGDETVNPGLSQIQNILLTATRPGDLLDDVPVEGPDSELLADLQGCWR